MAESRRGRSKAASPSTGKKTTSSGKTAERSGKAAASSGNAAASSDKATASSGKAPTSSSKAAERSDSSGSGSRSSSGAAARSGSHSSSAAARSESSRRSGTGSGRSTKATGSGSRQSHRKAGSTGGAEISLVDAARRVREQLPSLLGRPVEAILGVDGEDGNWVVTAQVVELTRIPNTTDVLGEYEASLDGEGNLVRYSRKRRYQRGQLDGGGQ